MEFLFTWLGIVPTDRSVSAIDSQPALNYTNVLNVVFLIVALVLVLRFVRIGGLAMLRMMGEPEPMLMDDSPDGITHSSPHTH